MSELPLDSELNETMETLFQIIKENPENRDSDDQLRMRIVSSNLKALANVLLIADSRPDVTADLKRIALGLLGTSDFLLKNLPELEEMFYGEGI